MDESLAPVNSVIDIESVRSHPLIPVIEIDKAKLAQPLAEAVLKGGISIIEIVLRTREAPEAIRIIRKNYPNCLVGAGTVVTLGEAAMALTAGAQFCVSPGIDPNIADYFRNHNVPFIPGVATPSEIQTAINHQCRLLKFFPASAAGGPEFLRMISTPFARFDVQFCATGGVTPENMNQYLEIPDVCSVGGTWFASAEQIRNQDWKGITRQVSLARTCLAQNQGR